MIDVGAAILAELPVWRVEETDCGQQQNSSILLLILKELFGEPGGTRTRDPLIKSQMLYQLSYRPLGITPAGNFYHSMRLLICSTKGILWSPLPSRL